MSNWLQWEQMTFSLGSDNDKLSLKEKATFFNSGLKTLTHYQGLGRRGESTQQNFIRGGSAPRCNPLPFYQFWPKNGPLSHTFNWQIAPLLHTNLESCIFLNCCKCTAFKLWTSRQTRQFSCVFHCHKTHLGPQWQISRTFYILQQE